MNKLFLMKINKKTTIYLNNKVQISNNNNLLYMIIKLDKI